MCGSWTSAGRASCYTCKSPKARGAPTWSQPNTVPQARVTATVVSQPQSTVPPREPEAAAARDEDEGMGKRPAADEEAWTRADLKFWKDVLDRCEGESSPDTSEIKQQDERRVQACKIALTKSKALPTHKEVLEKLLAARMKKLDDANDEVAKAAQALSAANYQVAELTMAIADARGQLLEVDHQMEDEAQKEVEAQLAEKKRQAMQATLAAPQQLAALAQMWQLAANLPQEQGAMVTQLLTAIMGVPTPPRTDQQAFEVPPRTEQEAFQTPPGGHQTSPTPSASTAPQPFRRGRAREVSEDDPERRANGGSRSPHGKNLKVSSPDDNAMNDVATPLKTAQVVQ